MALNTAVLQLGAAAIAAAITRMSIHTAQPDATGSNLSTAAKQPCTFTASGGNITLSATVNFTGGAASGPATYVGLWDTAGTTFYGAYPLTGDQTFNAAGAYSVTALSLTGSST